MAKWMIDPGHGGSDPGTVNNKTTEARMNLIVSLELAAHLRNNGETVYLTRETDKSITLSERAELANRYKVDYFVSVHHNSANGNARGCEVLYSLKTPSIFAERVLNSLCKGMNQISRGVKQRKNNSGGDYFAVLRLTNMQAIITEFCFIDNPTDYALVDTDAKLKHQAWYMAIGCLANVGKTIKTTANANKPTATNTVKDASAAANLVISREGKNKYTQDWNLRSKCDLGYSDCSALMQWAYKKAYGIDIGSYTEPQSERGKLVGKINEYPIDKSHLKVGDLVFYRGHSAIDKSRPYSIGHVEMYIGNGTLIGHGWGTGPTRKNMDSYRRADFCMIRRYYEGDPVKNTPTPKPTPPVVEKPKVPEKPKKMSKYFKDIPGDHWSIDHFDKAKELGLIAGTGDGKVGFNETKAQTIVMMLNLYNKINNEFQKK